MAKIANSVQIDLRDLVQLLNYYWSSVNSPIGDTGSVTYEENMVNIASQCSCYLTPEQLEGLVYTTKQAIFDKIKPIDIDYRVKSYHGIMKKLKSDIPGLFKELPSGEIVFANFKE